MAILQRSARPGTVLTLRLPRPLVALGLLLLVSLTALAGFTVYNLISAPVSGSARLNYAVGSQAREQDMQNIISRDNSRLSDLQKENQQREGEIAQQEAKLLELSQQLNDLKQKLAPGLTGGALTGSNYQSQLQQLEDQVASLKETIAQKQQNLDQLQNSFNDYNADLVRLSGDGAALPTKLTNLQEALALRPPDGLPSPTPLMTSSFGWRDNPFSPGNRGWHDGVDLACHIGEPVYATKAGIVTFASMDHNGYGLRVDITHENGWLTFYGHNSQILVRVGQMVNKGDVISLCGSTGASTGPHIHYGLHFNGAMVDPMRYINFVVKKDFGV